MNLVNDTSVNYSHLTEKRISKMKHLTDEQKAELLETMTLSDNELRVHKAEYKEKKSKISADAGEYLKYYDQTINAKIQEHKKNLLGPVKPAVVDKEVTESEKKKEWLVNMYFTLQQRHLDYIGEKDTYTPEQLAVVEKMEKETKGKVKFIVDTNFLKAFNKVMGVDYRGAGVFGNLVVVGDAKDLTDEGLLRHEAIHCAQQRDMGILLGLPIGTVLGVFSGEESGKEIKNHVGMVRWLLLSLVSKTVKQFAGKERFTPSAVDYGTDNQATDLETYMNQYNPDYLAKRGVFGHIKYYNPRFLQKEYKRVRDVELKYMKDKLTDLDERQRKGEKLSFHEIDMLKKLKDDIAQFEKMLKHLEKDKEIRTVLIETDVLPSKKDKESPMYDERAQVWTMSATNLKKMKTTEKNLFKNNEKQLAAKKAELQVYQGDERKIAEIQEDIKKLEAFGKMVKNDRDKSRKKAKQDRKALQAKRE